MSMLLTSPRYKSERVMTPGKVGGRYFLMPIPSAHLEHYKISRTEDSKPVMSIEIYNDKFSKQIYLVDNINSGKAVAIPANLGKEFLAEVSDIKDSFGNRRINNEKVSGLLNSMKICMILMGHEAILNKSEDERERAVRRIMYLDANSSNKDSENISQKVIAGLNHQELIPTFCPFMNNYGIKLPDGRTVLRAGNKPSGTVTPEDMEYINREITPEEERTLRKAYESIWYMQKVDMNRRRMREVV